MFYWEWLVFKSGLWWRKTVWHSIFMITLANMGVSAGQFSLFSSSHYFLHLNIILAAFIKSLIKSFLNLYYFVWIIPNKFMQSSKNSCMNVPLGWKNRICHHKFKSDTKNNGMTKRRKDTQKKLLDFPNKTLHTISFDWFLSGLEWILNLEFCLLKLLIF